MFKAGDQVEMTTDRLGTRRHRVVASISGAHVKQVTLTFDNGPVPGITDRVLDILDRTGLKTTFFVIGRNLLNPDAAALMRKAQFGRPLDRQSHPHSFRCAW